ncbi:hypothetical protein M5D96_007185 [Drosophila gunungcola]|uniref:Uncharacterized protein n=1 Tax=Drosophila gunungcola TaxID=103775 RepID=A0A9P9YN31_9MUSC|nr:hypothetical protein M5D96_007185 [Drosophila gunungcola]
MDYYCVLAALETLEASAELFFKVPMAKIDLVKVASLKLQLGLGPKDQLDEEHHPWLHGRLFDLIIRILAAQHGCIYFVGHLLTIRVVHQLAVRTVFRAVEGQESHGPLHFVEMPRIDIDEARSLALGELQSLFHLLIPDHLDQTQLLHVEKHIVVCFEEARISGWPDPWRI